jgi:carbamoyl-phosphate synthase/aspartate carbamoyltransferase/dihydroorotase
MRPRLASPADVEALWQHLETTIDCIATDHAPHTLAEKATSKPPPGVTGLETALPLMLTAVREKRLTLDRLVELMALNPRRIFKLPAQPETQIEVENTTWYTLSNEGLQTKCGWSPFSGRAVVGQVQRVVLRGEEVFRDGQVIAQPGDGKLLP